MSDEQPTDEQLSALMHDEEFLAANGYRITPKGYMSLVLMDMGVSSENAAKVAQEMEDRIFKAGWIYLQEDQLELVDPNE